MNKRGLIGIIIIAILVLAAIGGIVVWQKLKSVKDKITASQNATSNLTSSTGTNISQNTTANQSAENQTFNETESIPDDSVPNPSGSVTGIDLGNDANGGYYCNNKTNPEHQVKLYTYRILEGIKTLSDDYIESIKIDDVCNQYPEVTGGLRYNMRWQWSNVENIDGYRIYQYYDSDIENVTTRDFDYYIEISKIANQLIDTGPDLWIWEKPKTTTTATNSTNSSS